MARVPKKPAVKKKATQVRTQKKPTRKVSLAKGGAPQSKSRVNEAGNYTKPGSYTHLKLQTTNHV